MEVFVQSTRWQQVDCWAVCIDRLGYGLDEAQAIGFLRQDYS